MDVSVLTNRKLSSRGKKIEVDIYQNAKKRSLRWFRLVLGESWFTQIIQRPLKVNKLSNNGYDVNPLDYGRFHEFLNMNSYFRFNNTIISILKVPLENSKSNKDHCSAPLCHAGNDIYHLAIGILNRIPAHGLDKRISPVFDSKDSLDRVIQSRKPFSNLVIKFQM